MEAAPERLADNVHGSDSSLSQGQNGHQTNSRLPQDEEAKMMFPSLLNRESVQCTAPLIAEYNWHMDQMTEQMENYETQMAAFKKKLEEVVMENESLYAKLQYVLSELNDRDAASGVEESSTGDEEVIIRNLQEQIQLIKQDKLQAMELWQLAVQELDRLKQNISDGKVPEADRQQLQGRLVQSQQHVKQLQVASQKLEMTNQQLLTVVTEQSTELEMLQNQLRYSKAEQKKAMVKLEDMIKLQKKAQEQIKRLEEDVAQAQGQKDAADRRHQRLQDILSQLESRLIVASKDADEARREKAVAENLMEELRRRCSSLEKEKCEALEKLKESTEAVNIAKMQKTQALLREKQGAEVLEKTQECCSRLIRETPVRIRKEVENIHKQFNSKISSMNEELCALQLECATKQALIDRTVREKKAIEAELTKVCKERRAEPELRKIDALHQRCLNAERIKDDMSAALQSAQSKLKKSELDYREELSGCRDEIQQLRRSLAAAQDECSSVSEERLKLQQEILQLRKEMGDLRKVTMVDQKKAELQVSKMKQEYSLKEKLLKTRVEELEEYSRSSNHDLTRLLTAQQNCIQRLKEESKNAIQCFEANVAKLEAELNRQKQHSLKLGMQIESDHKVIAEYKRYVEEYKEKANRLQRRLTETEEKLNMMRTS